MKKYGIMLADNGSAWYISGQPDERWNNDHLHTLGQLLGSNFEAVDATLLRVDANSGAATQSGVSVTVTPSSAAVRTGRGKTFSATVTGAPNTVAWSVNGIAGGDLIVGTVDASGQYLAPTAAPGPSTVTLVASSTASPTSTGSASVSILPLPAVSSVSPSPVPTGSFTLTVNGVGFTAGSAVSFDGVALSTSFLSSTQLSATGSAAAAKPSVPIVVTTPDGELSNTFYVNVAAPPSVIVAISPTAATVRVNRSRQFTATVQDSSNASVVWNVNGVTGVTSAVGTITASGVYRAPSTVPNPNVVTVSATAVADPTKTASASVIIVRR